jgi:2,4-dienoyl-CoA reductase-like NADH-dependent reductase (Old Yellow Enzyme family)
VTLTDTSANPDLDLVWQPLTIKNVTLRNRIVRPRE